MVVEEDAGEVADEVAGAAEDAVVEGAVIVMDPVRIAAMTAVMTAVRIAVRTVAMVLGPAVALEDLVEVEVEAVEARKNSAWTRRPSPLWARLPLKVRKYFITLKIFQRQEPLSNSVLSLSGLSSL